MALTASDPLYSNYIGQISDINRLLRIEIDESERVHKQNTCRKRKKLDVRLEAR
jgi:hypothetical protein